MSGWAPYQQREAALGALEAKIAAAPDAIEPRFERANLLVELGRNDEARAAYLELLHRAPTHAGALNNFGTLLHATGYRDAARTAYAQAVAEHPDQPMGHVNLANLLLEDGELDLARTHYETALGLAPDHAAAHQGLGNLLAELGEAAAAREHRRRGFERQALTTLPYRGAGTPLSLLLLVSAEGGNIPLRPLLDDRTFLTHVIVAEHFDAAAPLPAHALVFNSIGDADLCRPALAAAEAILARTSAPVLNPPAKVAPTGRIDNAARLGTLPDVITPRMASLARAVLLGADAPDRLAELGLHFPLLLRAPGFHTGRHFVRVERAEDLTAAVATLPGEALTAIEPLPAQSADGLWRKYRVMLVGGGLYPLHLAVSRHWKVHYFTAAMAEDAAFRQEEAAFLADMPQALGPRARAALAAVRDTLGLDYAGIDFALDREGRVLLFEANATMVVNPPDPDPRFAYRRAAVERIHAAVRSMLIERSRSQTHKRDSPGGRDVIQAP